MMATTIMISTSVKPDLRDVLIFITDFSFCWRRELSSRRVLLVRFLVHTLPAANRVGHFSKPNAKPHPTLIQHREPSQVANERLFGSKLKRRNVRQQKMSSIVHLHGDLALVTSRIEDEKPRPVVIQTLHHNKKPEAKPRVS